MVLEQMGQVMSVGTSLTRRVPGNLFAVIGDPEDSLEACEKPGERRESRDCHGFVEPSRALDDVRVVTGELAIHFPELFHL